MRRLVATFKGTTLATVATRELEELANELLARVRDASFRRDRRAKDDANRELTEGFASDEILQRVRRDFSRKELDARELMRRGNQLEKVGQADVALQRYNAILENYSGTLAATKARDRVRVLKRRRAASDDNAILRETMRYEDKAGR
jgi:hypothetical protein